MIDSRDFMKLRLVMTYFVKIKHKHARGWVPTSVIAAASESNCVGSWRPVQNASWPFIYIVTFWELQLCVFDCSNKQTYGTEQLNANSPAQASMFCTYFRSILFVPALTIGSKVVLHLSTSSLSETKLFKLIMIRMAVVKMRMVLMPVLVMMIEARWWSLTSRMRWYDLNVPTVR